jgi:hypothetical protein
MSVRDNGSSALLARAVDARADGRVLCHDEVNDGPNIRKTVVHLGLVHRQLPTEERCLPLGCDRPGEQCCARRANTTCERRLICEVALVKRSDHDVEPSLALPVVRVTSSEDDGMRVAVEADERGHERILNAARRALHDPSRRRTIEDERHPPRLPGLSADYQLTRAHGTPTRPSGNSGASLCQ